MHRAGRAVHVRPFRCGGASVESNLGSRRTRKSRQTDGSDSVVYRLTIPGETRQFRDRTFSFQTCHDRVFFTNDLSIVFVGIKGVTATEEYGVPRGRATVNRRYFLRVLADTRTTSKKKTARAVGKRPLQQDTS